MTTHYYVTLTNDFHGTEYRLRLRSDPSAGPILRYAGDPAWTKDHAAWRAGQTVTHRTVRRIGRALCGSDDCTCSGIDGVRGGRYVLVEEATTLDASDAPIWHVMDCAPDIEQAEREIDAGEIQ